ncbi:MAG: hypothetical protein JWL70_774 [Acidimicrobiia bacterium]|nr:hypothetical protein [Acidimicrobiia bacterium]
MLATVQTVKVPTPITDELRRQADTLSAEARGAEGLESMLTVVDPGTGEGFTINVFRDQASLDSFQALAERLTKEAETGSNASVSAARTYEVLTS